MSSEAVQDQSDWALLAMIPGLLGLKPTTVTFDESERQAILLALASLAVDRPGWDYMLNEIALKLDRNIEGRAMMFEALKSIKLRHIVPDLAHKAMILDSAPLTSLMKGEFGDPIKLGD